MEIWINPACSKCRVALADLDADHRAEWLDGLAAHPRARSGRS